MNKYLKSHITAAAFCAGVLLAVSCSTSREPRTMRLFMQSGRPNIFLPHEESAPSGVLAEQVGFTTSSDTLPGEFEEVSDSTDDVWKTIHLGGVDIVAARTVVKQVTMREGSVRLEFNIHVPSLLIDSCWRVTLTPMLCTSDSSGFPLPPVVLSGSSFTRMQEADYKAYRLFLNGIVDPSAYDSVYLDRKGINKDIACRQRFFYELYGKERDRQLAYEKWKRLALERQNFWNTRTQANRATLRHRLERKRIEESVRRYVAGRDTLGLWASYDLVLVNPGDEVIVPAPYWVSYPEMVKMAEGTPVIVSAGIEQDFKITPEQLEAAITPKTKALILCSPSNPTGSVYTKEELAGLSAVLAKHPQVIVIADEIYEHINYIGAHQSIAQFPEMKERTVIVNGVSKAYAMTGWRIGFIAGPEWIVKACNKLQGQYTSGPCSVSQKAAEVAYTGTQEPVKEMQKAFQRRRDLIVKLAKEVPGFEVNVPQGAFYLFPKCDAFFGKSNGERKIADSDDLAMYLLEEAHVACVGGASFGAPECIRMSYATSDENIVEAIRRIKEALAKLK